MLKILFCAFLLFINGCTIGYIGEIKGRRKSDETDYKTKEGYQNRKYSQKNVDLLENAMYYKSIDGAIIKKDIIDNAEKIINKSNEDYRRQLEGRVSEYVKMHEDILSDAGDDFDEEKNKDNDPNYFDIDGYKRVRPKKNITTIRYLDTKNIIPMTSEIEKDFLEYYKMRPDKINITLNTDNENYDVLKNNEYLYKGNYNIKRKKEKLDNSIIDKKQDSLIGNKQSFNYKELDVVY